MLLQVMVQLSAPQLQPIVPTGAVQAQRLSLTHLAAVTKLVISLMLAGISNLPATPTPLLAPVQVQLGTLLSILDSITGH